MLGRFGLLCVLGIKSFPYAWVVQLGAHDCLSWCHMAGVYRLVVLPVQQGATPQNAAHMV